MNRLSGKLKLSLDTARGSEQSKQCCPFVNALSVAFVYTI